MRKRVPAMIGLALVLVLAFAALRPFWSNMTFAQTPGTGNAADSVQGNQFKTPMGKKLGNQFMCQCGCGLTISACRDSMTCSVASGLVEQIERQVAMGKTEPQIKQYMTTVYGEQILALPSKSGFNVTAWMIPFLGVAVGAVGMGAFAFLWARRRAAARQTVEVAAQMPGLTSYEERVDHDIELME